MSVKVDGKEIEMDLCSFGERPKKHLNSVILKPIRLGLCETPKVDAIPP
jgi:hypothetical protein